MRTILATTLVILVVQVLGTAAAIYSGVFNVAATDAHWSLTQVVIDVARTRSIKARAAGIIPPVNLADHKRVVAGTSHFANTAYPATQLPVFCRASLQKACIRSHLCSPTRRNNGRRASSSGSSTMASRCQACRPGQASAMMTSGISLLFSRSFRV